MKTKILLVGLVLAISTGIYAQTINLTVNDNKTFQMNTPSANTTGAFWNDNGGGYVSHYPTFTRLYDVVGNFTLSVYPVSDLGCYGDIRSYTINVVTDVTTLPEQIAITGGTIAAICPQTTGQPTGGTASVNLTLTGFTVAAAETWSVSYKIGLTGTPASVTITGNNPLTFPATASGEVYIMGFTHGSGPAASSTFYNNTNAPHAALTVNPAPTIEGIF